MCLIAGPILGFSQAKPDILHYRFEIELNDKDDTIRGKAVIKLLAPKGTKSVTLDLTGDAATKSKGMMVTKASAPYRIPFNESNPNVSTHTKDKLQIYLWGEVLKEDTLTVAIEYKGVPVDGLIIAKNKYGKRTFFADNWPNRAHNWIPCVDEPGDKATVEFLVTAPDHYQVVSNGLIVEESNLPGDKKLTHWQEAVPLPTKVMVIGVADFAVAHAGFVNECIPVSSWVYPENKDKGFNDYSIGKEILEFYINYIGPYAYEKLANVQSKTIFGGMENAGAIFYAEETVTGKRDEERLFAHEIVHQWFGNMATEKNFSHFWLSEGFATYLSYVYLESKKGAAVLEESMKQDRVQVLLFVKNAKRPVVDTTSDYMSLLNANSYQKGGWILHMLRRQLGDTVFKKAIRKYFSLYSGKNAETKDLQNVFESVSGTNLEQFFKQWLYVNENPQLELLWKYEVAKKELVITVNQKQKSLFAVPLEIKTGGKDAKIFKLNLTKQTEQFRFKVPAIVNSVQADPHTSLLAEVSVSQIK